jgi:hypothetical protein
MLGYTSYVVIGFRDVVLLVRVVRLVQLVQLSGSRAGYFGRIAIGMGVEQVHSSRSGMQ